MARRTPFWRRFLAREPSRFIDIPLRNDQGELTGKTSRYAVLADGVYARLTPDQSLPSISTVPATQETPLYPGGPTRGEMGIPDAARPVLTPTASRPMAPPTERPERPVTTMTLGAVGTLFTAGFLTDLQEYNAQFIGRNALPYYDKMFRTSVPVRASLRACWLPIETAEWEVRPALNPNDQGYQFAVELADMVRENLFGGLETPMRTGGYASQTFKSVISNALLCLLYGCAAHEILWAVDGSRVRLRALAPRLPITFYRWWVDYDGMTLLGLEQLGYRRNEYVNVIVPAQKLTTFSFGKLGAGFYGISVLRSAFIDWYFLDNLTRINGIAAEHNAVGVPHFEIPEGASPSDVETARKYVTELAAHEAMGVVSPPGFKFEMKGVTGQTHNVVESMRYHAAQIYMNVLAGFLHLAEKVTGSYATGETLSDFFNLAENSVAEMIAEEINLSAVRRLVDYNYELPHTLRIDRMPYPLLKPAKIAVLNPIKLFESIRWLMQDNTDAIQPSDALENKLLELAGLPAKEKARPRFRAIAQTVREAEKGPEDTIPGEPESERTIPKQEPALTMRLTEPVKFLPYSRVGENKINLRAQSSKAESTARRVAETLRSRKSAWLDELRRMLLPIDRSDRRHGLALEHDRDAAAKIAALLKRNADYGRERVFSERWRATGRRRDAEVLNLRGLKLEEEAKEKKKPVTRTPEELAMLAVAQSQGWLIGLANSFTVTGLERGLTGEPLAEFVVENVAGASDGALDNAALRASRNAIQAGRFDAYGTLAPEIRMWYRHEFDDDHTCDACLEGSGDAYYSLEEIDWWPGKDCEGGRMCRGELTEIFQDEGKYEWGK